jgi:hypothetical protein
MRLGPPVAFVTLLALAGCGGSSLPANPGTAAPANRAAAAQSTLAAQTTAQTEFGLLSGGDYGHAWDLWSDPAKQVISRADFITLNTTCPVALGTPTKVVAARPVSNTSVAVDWQRAAQTGVGQTGAAQTGAAQTGTVNMVYAGGAWRFEPAAQDYRAGLSALIARRRAAHECPAH